MNRSVVPIFFLRETNLRDVWSLTNAGLRAHKPHPPVRALPVASLRLPQHPPQRGPDRFPIRPQPSVLRDCQGPVPKCSDFHHTT